MGSVRHAMWECVRIRIVAVKSGNQAGTLREAQPDLLRMLGADIMTPEATLCLRHNPALRVTAWKRGCAYLAEASKPDACVAQFGRAADS